MDYFWNMDVLRGRKSAKTEAPAPHGEEQGASETPTDAAATNTVFDQERQQQQQEQQKRSDSTVNQGMQSERLTGNQVAPRTNKGLESTANEPLKDSLAELEENPPQQLQNGPGDDQNYSQDFVDTGEENTVEGQSETTIMEASRSLEDADLDLFLADLAVTTEPDPMMATNNNEAEENLEESLRVALDTEAIPNDANAGADGEVNTSPTLETSDLLGDLSTEPAPAASTKTESNEQKSQVAQEATEEIKLRTEALGDTLEQSQNVGESPPPAISGRPEALTHEAMEEIKLPADDAMILPTSEPGPEPESNILEQHLNSGARSPNPAIEAKATAGSESMHESCAEEMDPECVAKEPAGETTTTAEVAVALDLDERKVEDDPTTSVNESAEKQPPSASVDAMKLEKQEGAEDTTTISIRETAEPAEANSAARSEPATETHISGELSAQSDSTLPLPSTQAPDLGQEMGTTDFAATNAVTQPEPTVDENDGELSTQSAYEVPAPSTQAVDNEQQMGGTILANLDPIQRIVFIWCTQGEFWRLSNAGPSSSTTAASYDPVALEERMLQQLLMPSWLPSEKSEPLAANRTHGSKKNVSVPNSVEVEVLGSSSDEDRGTEVAKASLVKDSLFSGARKEEPIAGGGQQSMPDERDGHKTSSQQRRQYALPLVRSSGPAAKVPPVKRVPSKKSSQSKSKTRKLKSPPPPQYVLPPMSLTKEVQRKVGVSRAVVLDGVEKDKTATVATPVAATSVVSSTVHQIQSSVPESDKLQHEHKPVILKVAGSNSDEDDGATSLAEEPIFGTDEEKKKEESQISHSASPSPDSALGDTHSVNGNQVEDKGGDCAVEPQNGTDEEQKEEKSQIPHSATRSPEPTNGDRESGIGKQVTIEGGENSTSSNRPSNTEPERAPPPEVRSAPASLVGTTPQKQSKQMVWVSHGKTQHPAWLWEELEGKDEVWVQWDVTRTWEQVRAADVEVDSGSDRRKRRRSSAANAEAQNTRTRRSTTDQKSAASVSTTVGDRMSKRKQRHPRRLIRREESHSPVRDESFDDEDEAYPEEETRDANRESPVLRRLATSRAVAAKAGEDLERKENKREESAKHIAAEKYAAVAAGLRRSSRIPVENVTLTYSENGLESHEERKKRTREDIGVHNVDANKRRAVGEESSHEDDAERGSIAREEEQFAEDERFVEKNDAGEEEDQGYVRDKSKRRKSIPCDHCDETNGSHFSNDYWTTLNDRWNAKFEELKAFKKEFHHETVPLNEPAQHELALWVKNQRARKRDHVIWRSQVDKLESIGFQWVLLKGQSDVFRLSFQKNCEKLKNFKRRFSHVMVPILWKEDPVLAQWVQTQRRRRKFQTISKDEIDQLDVLGFVWCAGSDWEWEQRFKDMVAFKNEYGHCMVPRTSAKCHPLKNWVYFQRRKFREGTLEKNRITKLNEIGFDWDPPRQKPSKWKFGGSSR